MPTIILKNTDDLREFLKRGNLLQYLDVPSFEFDVIAFEKATQEVLRQRPHYTQDRAEARAAYRLLSMQTVSTKSPVIAQGKTRWVRTLKTAWNISREGSRPPIFTTSRVWHWIKIIWAILMLAGVITVAFEGRAHAQGNSNGTGNAGNALEGISLQFQNAGTPLATKVTGRVNINCSTNLSCSFSGNTFTLTSTGGGGGSGCVPPGTVTNSLLVDLGGGLCGDVTKFTSNGTTTITGLATSILDLGASASIKIPFSAGCTTVTNGNLCYDTTSLQGKIWQNGADRFLVTSSVAGTTNGQIPIFDATLKTFVPGDPLVQGLTAHDAVGTSTNPVLIGGYASAAAPSDVSADGDATRLWVLRNGSPVMNLASGGTLITATGSSANINCTNCGFPDNSAYTVGTNSINVIGGYYTSGAAPALTSGNAGRFRIDANSYLLASVLGSKTNNNAVPGATNLGTLPAVATAAAPTYTEGDQVALSVDLAGTLRSTAGGGGGGGITQVRNTTNTATDVGYFSGDLNLPVQEVNSGLILDAIRKNATLTPSTYGQNPGLIKVPAVNAYITNMPGQNFTQVNGIPLTGQTAGSLPVTIVAGAGSGGTASSFAAAFPATGTAIGVKNGANMVNLNADGSGNLLAAINAALPAGTNVIGHTISDTGSTTTVTQATGTNLHAVLDATSTTAVTQATAASLNATVVGTGTFVTQATDNVTQFGGTNLSTGTGASGAGIPRVTVSNDSIVGLAAGSAVIGHVLTDSGSVTAATLSAETTKVIGTTRTLGNAGGIMDFAGQNAASPASAFLVGCQFNTSPTTITNGNASPFQCNNAGALLVAGSSGGGVAQTQVQNVSGTYTCVGYASGCFNMPTQDASMPQLLSAMQMLTSTLKTERVLGAFNQPIGSFGDSLKVSNTAADPCFFMSKIDVAISQTAITKLVPAGAYPIHICKLRIDATTAEIVSAVDGTGPNCGTSQVAHSGSTTAANGESFATNGGFQEGGAGVTVYTIPPGKDFCILESGSNRVSGTLQYVYAP